MLGISYVYNGKQIITGARPLIRDLDSLPFPSRHLLPMKEYFSAVKKNPLRGEVRKPWAAVITRQRLCA